MQIRTRKFFWGLTHQNKTKIDSDEDVDLSIYHRAASKKNFAILKFYFGGHLHLKLQLQQEVSVAVEVEVWR